MKIVVGLVAILLVKLVSAQEDEFFQVTPDWKIGDSRTVHVEEKTTTFIEDTVFSYMNMVSDYSIEVVDVKDHYTLLYSQSSDDFNVKSSSDSLDNFIVKITKLVEKKLDGFEYKIVVNKETGLAFDVMNSDELMSKMKVAIHEVVEEIGKQKGKTETEIKEAQVGLEGYITPMAPQMIETVINGVNYLFQAYSYTFPLDDVVVQDITTYDVNAMGAFGTTEFPATQTLESISSEDRLVIKTSLDYDKEFLLEQMKKKSNSTKDLTVDDLYISEKENVIIDLNSTWIEKHVSDVEFRLPNVKVINHGTIEFRK